VSDTTVTLRLHADNAGLLPPVKQAQAAVGELGKAAGQSGRAGAAGLSNIGKAASTAERDVGRLGQTAKLALGSVAALASVSVAKQLAGSFLQAADRAGQLSARMQLATQNLQEYNYAMERSKQVAHNSYQSINQVAEIAIRAAEPMQQLGFSIKDTLDLTEALSLSLVVSGANQQKSAAAIDQFSKAMQTGTLRGQEFQTVLENAPRFVTALEQSLGKTRAELISMARDGELTIDTLSGVARQLAALRDETEAMPTTLDDAKTRFGNAWQEFAEGVSKTVNSNQTLVKVIEIAADNLGNLALAAGAVALVFAGRLANALTETTQRKLADMAASRAAAQAELQAARAAQAAAAGRLSAVRAGMGGALSLAAAETQFAMAQTRTTAATIAASNALRAKAAAVSLAKGALAMFGGPVGLAVTALTAFVLWARNSRMEAEQLAESVNTHFQGAMGTFKAFNEETANMAFSGLASANKTLAEAVQDLANKERQVAEQLRQNQKVIAQTGQVYQSQIEKLADYRQQLDAARLTRQHLMVEEHRAIKLSIEMVQQAAGIANATEAETWALRDKLRELSNLGQTLDEVKPHLVDYFNRAGDTTSANNLLAASFANLSQSMKRVDWGEIDKSLAQHIESAELRRIELTQGKLARRRLELDGLLPDGNFNPAERAQRQAQIDAILAAEAANDRLAESARHAAQAAQEAQRAEEELKRTREQQAHSQAKYADEAAMVAAQLNGPIAEAEEQRIQRIKSLDAELEKLNITEAAHTTLVNAARTAEAKRMTELRNQQSAPRSLLDTMTGELKLLVQTRNQREGLTRQLHAEHEMREAITEAIEAGNAALRDSPDEQARLVQHARALASASIEIERHTERVQEWADVATRGVAGIADVFTDVATSTIRTSRDMFRALKDVWKRGFADLIRTALEQNFVRPIQDALLGMLSGQGFAAAGQSTGNLAQTLAKGVSGQVTQHASSGIVSHVIDRMRGLFGGTAVMSASSTASSAAPAAAGMTGAAGMASAIPIAGWIAAGMMANASMYRSGWDVGGQATDIFKTILKGTGPFGGVVAAPILTADKLLRNLGIGGKMTSLLTGSSLLARAFGRRAPRMTGQGIQGQYGFDGFNGQFYRDVHQKGGWFRSSKRWTQTSAIDPEIKTLFDGVAKSVSGQAQKLAAQIGTDINQRLSRVRVDIGRIELDSDPEKARQQLQNAAESMLDRLAQESVKGLGFGRLLNRGFEGAEVLDALSTTMDVVAGHAAELGRSLTSLELDNVNRATEWLMQRATQNATSLGDETASVIGMLRNYADTMANVHASIRTSGLNQFQRAALDIERQYREQVKSVNALARSLGLSAARAEDLAAIEQVRALNMANVQRQLETERHRLQDDLRISQYSPFNDQQKLSEAMLQLSSAVATGDVQQARSLSQSALELGRSLYASGNDYNILYRRVNGLLNTLGDGLNLEMSDGTTMGDLADILVNLPNNIAKSLFEQLHSPAVERPNRRRRGLFKDRGEEHQTLKNIEQLLRKLHHNSDDSLQRHVADALR